MLDSWPICTPQVNPVRREVGKAAIGIIHLVKVNGRHTQKLYDTLTDILPDDVTKLTLTDEDNIDAMATIRRSWELIGGYV